jgi:hypothetical protein
MKKIVQLILFSSLATVLLVSCRELYTPPAITASSNYLVVDGLINTGTDSTIIALSRTVSLNSKTTIKTEAKAKVTVESDANASYPLKEIKTGTYASPSLGLNKTAKYRLRIITADNKTYLSDFIAGKDSPAIDSLGYAVQPNGLQIYVNTHDATNNSRYYRWDYIETWNFHSQYSSSTIVSGNLFIDRTPDQQIFSCWASDVSADIVLASSAKLTQDVIYNSVITTVPSSAEKLSGLGYSILVRQYALTQDAFNFWQNLKKNTEQLGSIFDAQPSEIQGNIHNINNNAEPVFGYISAGTTQQKRITVLYDKWPIGWGTNRPTYASCIQDTVFNKDLSSFLGPAPLQIPLFGIPGPSGGIIGYMGSSPLCVDCTLRGTNKKPSFWPN